MSEIQTTNDGISQQIEHGNQELSEITKLISNIESKTKIINDIVFQTKLLSFNASVEAARAGEYGKGFSVVAEEVGNLAQMSGKAAKEISALLAESIQKVNRIVDESRVRVDKMIQASKEKVELGNETVRECDLALEKILENVGSVDSLVSEISLASEEQALGIKEISKAVGQMENVTQENSILSKNSSDNAERLKSQSSNLRQVVNRLVMEVSGYGSVEAESVPDSELALDGQGFTDTVTHDKKSA